MPKPRTPTAILERRGAFKKNPQRRRGAEPEVDSPLGAPPAHLGEEQVACWQELAEQAPAGVLTGADRWSVEIAAALMAEFRSRPDDFTAAKLRKLHGLLGSLGLTPADRTRLSVPISKAKLRLY